jgi:hypothetical protein
MDGDSTGLKTSHLHCPLALIGAAVLRLTGTEEIASEEQREDVMPDYLSVQPRSILVPPLDLLSSFGGFLDAT